MLKITDDGAELDINAIFQTQGIEAGLRAALIAAKEAEDLSRQDNAKQLLDYYNKQFLTYLETELDKRFPVSSARIKPFIAVQPVVGPIVRKRALVMKNGVQAEVVLQDLKAVDDTKSTLLNEILPENWVETLKKIERVVDLQGRVTVQVLFRPVDPVTGRPHIEWDIIPAHTFEVIQDPNRLTIAAAYIIRKTAQDTVNDPDTSRTVWTSAGYATYDGGDAMEGPLVENPYNGMMPFQDFVADVAMERYWPELDISFITGQDNVNISWTWVMIALALQSCGIPVRTNGDGMDMQLSPFTFLDLKSMVGQPAPDFRFETPDTNITQIIDAVGSYVDMLYLSQGVPPWRRTKQVSSADSQNMEMRDVLETRQEKVGIYETQIKRLLQRTAVVWGTHTVGTAEYREIPLDLIRAKIAPVEIAMSEKEQAEAAKIRVEAKLSSPVDEIQKMGNISREAAEEKYQKIIADLKRAGAAIVTTPLFGGR